MLRKILIGVALVLVLFVALVATRPAAYHVERKLELAAPADVVFDVVNDLHQFVGVLVLFGEKLDPNMQKTFAGPATGVGQSVAWSGDTDAGTGKLTIDESVAGQKVRVKLEIVEPMESTASYALTLAPTPTGSLVTWSMDGNHNFIGKAFGLFVDMDSMLGADLDKSLAQLKAVAEAKHVDVGKAVKPAEAP